MPVLVKSHDVRSGRKAKVRQERHRRQMVNKKPRILIFQNFWRFWPQFRSDTFSKFVPNGPSFGKWGHVIELELNNFLLPSLLSIVFVQEGEKVQSS